MTPTISPRTTAHVFIDNSNIFGGAQRAAKTLEPSVPWPAIRLYYRHLFQIVEDGRTALTRVMGGSVPPGNDALWQHARDGGYTTDLLKRVEDDKGRLYEQAVDELLHLKISMVLHKHAPGTLVLVTGDGRVSDYETSFTELVAIALKNEWAVEVWSWKVQLSNAYSRLITTTGSLKIIELEPYYESITFVKGGTYNTPQGQLTVGERVVTNPPRRV